MNIQRGAFSCNHPRAGTVVRRQTVHVADESLPFPGSCRGRLLVATPPLDDPNFDLHHHIRHVALPAPGTMRQLLDLASLLTADAFDRTRPLWQFVVVDGIRGGKSALIEKLHHTIVDGEGGVQLSLQFLDLERDAPEPPPLDCVLPPDEPDAPEDVPPDWPPPELSPV